MAWRLLSSWTARPFWQPSGIASAAFAHIMMIHCPCTCCMPGLIMRCCAVCAVIVSCSKQLEGEAEVSKMEALQWVAALVARGSRCACQEQAWR